MAKSCDSQRQPTCFKGWKFDFEGKHSPLMFCVALLAVSLQLGEQWLSLYWQVSVLQSRGNHGNLLAIKENAGMFLVQRCIPLCNQFQVATASSLWQIFTKQSGDTPHWSACVAGDLATDFTATATNLKQPLGDQLGNAHFPLTTGGCKTSLKGLGFSRFTHKDDHGDVGL